MDLSKLPPLGSALISFHTPAPKPNSLSILTLPNHPHTPKSLGSSLSPPKIFVHAINQHTAASSSSACKKVILSSAGAIPKLLKKENVL